MNNIISYKWTKEAIDKFNLINSVRKVEALHYEDEYEILSKSYALEKYMDLIKYELLDNSKVHLIRITIKDSNVISFINTFSKMNSIEILFCFYDLENTLVSFYKDYVDYEINLNSGSAILKLTSESIYNYLRNRKGYTRISFEPNITKEDIVTHCNCLTNLSDFYFNCRNNPKSCNYLKRIYLKTLAFCRNYLKNQFKRLDI